LKTLKNAQLDYSTVVKQYFSTQSDQQLLNEINWRIIANGVSDINSREFRFVLSHQKEFSSIASPERVNRKIFYLVKELLTPLVETKDTTNYFIARKSASEIHIFNVDSLIFTYDLKLYELTANWDAYREISLQSTTTYLWNDYIQLNIIATNYLKHISDTLALLKAVQWTQRALSLNEEYSICLLGSKLYQKMNKIPDAIQMAQQGKDIAVKYGWDSTEPDRLLNELKSTPKNN